MSKNNWTRNEHIVAFALYCQIPFSKINQSNRDVCELATLIGRSKGSVAMKLANFARLDPELQRREISGLTRGAKGEVDVWNEYYNNWEKLAFDSESILAEYRDESILSLTNLLKEDNLPMGTEKKAVLKLRINQSFFRRAVLASYDYRCCITGINVPELLIAGHIVPWSVNEEHRTNPNNGLCFNALHDKAFDRGLITITPDFEVKISSVLKEAAINSDLNYLFASINGRKIFLPHKFYPNREFLDYHNRNIFKS